MTAFLKNGVLLVSILTCLYTGLLCILATKWAQTHAVYLHAVQMTWCKDLDVPQRFGFLRNQVTPFSIQSGDSNPLYTWHILPTELYRKHEQQLLRESTGFVASFQTRLAFHLLTHDPDARLIIHFHGAAGTVGSGHRPLHYRALSAAMPEKIHVLTFDYRGFGRTAGTPSEEGIIADALIVVDWALNVAEIPASRILLSGQSLGTAVNAAVAENYARQDPAIIFLGHISVAPFVDVATLASTYRVAGWIPILGPLANFPTAFDYLRTLIRDSWTTKDRLANYVHENEKYGRPYNLAFIHAKDDYVVPWTHTQALFEYSVTAGMGGDSANATEVLDTLVVDRGAGGTLVECISAQGIIRQEIVEYGLHDAIMGDAVVTIAVMRIIADPIQS